MLGKLIKYEFKATGRLCLPLFGALLIVALVSRLFMTLRFQTPTAIGIALSVIMMISVFVIVLIITLQRFYKNLLSTEGYLMFTLPVTTDSIIWSKLIVAFVWNILSMVVVFLAISIMAITKFDCREALAELWALINQYGITQMQLTGFIAEFILLCIISLLAGIIVLYACMSSSLLVNKHRVLFSFGAYIVLSIVGQILSSIVVFVVMPKQLAFYEHPNVTELVGMVNTMFVMGIVFSLAAGIVLYFFTRFMLKNKLNLE